MFMINKTLLTFLIAQIAWFSLLAQSDSAKEKRGSREEIPVKQKEMALEKAIQDIEDKEKALEKIENNLDTLEETFDEQRNKLKVHEISKIKGLNKQIIETQKTLDSLSKSSDKNMDTGSLTDDSQDNQDVSLGLGDEEFNFELKDEEELSNLKSHWMSLDIGFSNYLNDNSLSLPDKYQFLDLNTGKSLNVKLTLLKVGVNLIDHNLSLLTGLGLEWNNYDFSNRTVLTSSNADTLSTRTFDQNLKKYKLVTQYAFMPLTLHFETKPEEKEKSFQFSVGGRFGYLIRAHTKLKMNDGDKAKDFDDYHLRDYKLGGIARLGFGRYLSLYANYDVTHLFEDNVGPGLNPVTLGVTINGFSWD